MSTKDNGGAAFPAPETLRADGEVIGCAEQGMTLRDYFAAKAMHAFVERNGFGERETAAKAAYDMADAMLEARNA